MKTLEDIVAVLLILVSALCLGTSCEVSSADSSITVSPSTATLTPGEQQTFTASGGYEYTWSLDPDDGSGQLSATKGESTVYTCLSTNIGSMPKKVVVTSTITGSGTSTNSTSYSVEGSAEIYWPNGTGGGGNVSISGSTSDLSTNATRTFSASGGTPSYYWTVSGGGAVSPETTTSVGESTTYTPPASAATATIRATDSNGKYDEVTFSVVP